MSIASKVSVVNIINKKEKCKKIEKSINHYFRNHEICNILNHIVAVSCVVWTVMSDKKNNNGGIR